MQGGPASNCVKSTILTPSRQSSSTPNSAMIFLPRDGAFADRNSLPPRPGDCYCGAVAASVIAWIASVQAHEQRQAAADQRDPQHRAAVAPPAREQHRVDRAHPAGRRSRSPIRRSRGRHRSNSAVASARIISSRIARSSAKTIQPAIAACSRRVVHWAAGAQPEPLDNRVDREKQRYGAEARARSTARRGCAATC